MRKFLWLLALCFPLFTHAAVINVEFKFTPFTGDINEDAVQTVAGTARVYVNNILLTERPIRSEKAMVLAFDEREVQPPIWLPVSGLGPRLRKGSNALRVEFDPADPNLAYQAQLQWSLVNDETVESSSGPGQFSATNQSGGGTDRRTVTGSVMMERQFNANFAADLPWHHYPAVSKLSAEDRNQLLELLRARAKAFQPDFTSLYALLANNTAVDANAIRQAGCVDRAYTAGLRISVLPENQIEFATGNTPEVLLKAKGESLFAFDIQLLRKAITERSDQFCLGSILQSLYPSSLAAVRDPQGDWVVVY